HSDEQLRRGICSSFVALQLQIPRFARDEKINWIQFVAAQAIFSASNPHCSSTTTNRAGWVPLVVSFSAFSDGIQASPPISSWIFSFPANNSPSAEIELNVVRPEAVRKDPSLAFRPGRDLAVLKCDYQEIMLVAREFSSFTRRDCHGKGADTVVFEQQTLMRLSRDLDWSLLLR